MVTTVNLTSYYECEDNLATTNVIDIHGSNDGTADRNTNLFSTSSGLINRALDFNGSSDNVQVSNFSLGTTGSISFWFNTDSINNQQLVDTSNTSNGINIQIFNQNIVARVDGDGFLFHGLTINTGTWYNVIFKWDGVNWKLNVNDGTQVTKSSSQQPTTTSRTLIFAETSAGITNLNGRMDEIAIWSRLISDLEDEELFNSGAGLAYPFSTVTATTRKIKIAGTFQDKPILKKVAGVFVDKPIQVKVGGVFQDA